MPNRSRIACTSSTSRVVAQYTIPGRRSRFTSRTSARRRREPAQGSASKAVGAVRELAIELIAHASWRTMSCEPAWP
jgi:hypothetical protein